LGLRNTAQLCKSICDLSPKLLFIASDQVHFCIVDAGAAGAAATAAEVAIFSEVFISLA